MLDLRRLRLLRELHERGTIAAVADALQFTPSAVSQQLAMLEREAGVPLLERAGPRRAADRPGARAGRPRRGAAGARRRSPRPTSPRPPARSPAAARIAAFQSVGAAAGAAGDARRWPRGAAAALRAGRGRARAGAAGAGAGRRRPRAGRRVAAPALATARRRRSAHELLRDPVRLVLPAGHPAARRHRDAVPLAELAGEAWTTGHPGSGWEEMTQRTCRELGGFEPDIRHRTNDATVSLALVAARAGRDAAARARRCRATIPGVALRDDRRGPARAARSSPPPAPPTPRARRRRRCSPRCARWRRGCRATESELPQAVADAAHRLQRARAVAELAPQPGHGDLDDVGAAGPLVAPDVAQERLARDRLVLAVAQVARARRTRAW